MNTTQGFIGIPLSAVLWTGLPYPLACRHGASSGCGWRRPPVTEGSCEYIE